MEADPDPAPLPADNMLSPGLSVPSVPLSLIATTTTTTSATATHSTNGAAPLEQIAPTFVAMAKTTDGNQEMTIRLQPAELGMVQVRVERALSGSTLVEITAEKWDTLQALQQDQPQLHRMLDEAGFPAVGRTVTFHVAQPAQPSSDSSGSWQSGGQSAGQHASSGRMDGGNSQDGAAAKGDKDDHPARETNPWTGGRRQSIPPASAGTDATTRRTYRVGLDITA